MKQSRDRAVRPDVSGSEHIKRGTRDYLLATLALFSAGLATFALLYCVQPLMPALSEEFGVSPAASSLSLSVSTGLLALGLLITGPLSDAVGRKSVMVTALLMAAVFTLISAGMSSWHGVLAMRALTGLALSGVAAVGMTWLSEEVHPSALAFSMGLYISGNSIGGMSGRLLSGIIADFSSWRIAVSVTGCFALAAALLFWKILPPSRHFRPASLKPRSLMIGFRLHWRDPGLPLLFAEGFLLMGAFVTLFNYIGYRLMAPPWSLSQAVVGLLSVVYLTGSWSSPRAGALTARYGRAPVLLLATAVMLAGALLTLSSHLPGILAGMMLFTAGFFAAHAVASGWIGPRARRARGQASSLYLFSYYLGSSLAGTPGGIFWTHFGWGGITAFIASLLGVALLVGLRLSRKQV
ncbi:MFS transporter [Erwinia sp. P6884]|uniref:MFS transporter n=1 Tax=Erwinia sp. P6884 TaxID=3141450 RepID=UPI0031954979